jgi:hypothetical protein
VRNLYHIAGLCPRTDIDMGRCGFAVKLYPAWKDAVAAYPLSQQHADNAVRSMGRAWLAGCGFDLELYAASDVELRHSVHIKWGEWGPEHITVPGNACGLDLDDGIGKPAGGKILQPHNVDSIQQAHLLLVVFTFFADCLVMDQECRVRWTPLSRPKKRLP